MCEPLEFVHEERVRESSRVRPDVDLETLAAEVSKLADQPRFQTLLVGFFAATGIVMALIGLYGVISFLVTARTQEIGVRLALGANKADILRLVMGQSLRLITAGTALGLIAALAATRVLSSQLFGIGANDPGTFVIVTLLLILVALTCDNQHALVRQLPMRNEGQNTHSGSQQQPDGDAL